MPNTFSGSPFTLCTSGVELIKVILLECRDPDYPREPDTKSSQGLPGRGSELGGVWDQESCCRVRRGHGWCGLGEQEGSRQCLLFPPCSNYLQRPQTQTSSYGALSPATQNTGQDREHQGGDLKMHRQHEQHPDFSLCLLHVFIRSFC